jgi:hypothetical protein
MREITSNQWLYGKLSLRFGQEKKTGSGGNSIRLKDGLQNFLHLLVTPLPVAQPKSAVCIHGARKVPK